MNKNLIHNTSIVSSNTKIGNNVSIGPYCIIENDVIIGSNTKIDAHTIVKQYTEIGKNNHIFSHCVIGEIPQDKKFSHEKTKLIIGNNNVIREFCTLNRGTIDLGTTTIGNDCLLMAYVHIGHDCIISNNIILANGVQLGGHVIIDDFAIVGGLTPVHQFCKIGEHSLVGGGLRVVQDIPPFIIANGQPLRFSGINSIGLRRRNFKPIQRSNIKKAYKIIYNSNHNTSQALEKIKNDLSQKDEILTIVNFIDKSSRGII
ncbi:MAG: acyl-ACP--UDP-N-acetylglucosamine O-acyltransferase [Candidatus Neomarinimicrobiota bacterium]